MSLLAESKKMPPPPGEFRSFCAPLYKYKQAHCGFHVSDTHCTGSCTVQIGLPSTRFRLLARSSTPDAMHVGCIQHYTLTGGERSTLQSVSPVRITVSCIRYGYVQYE